MDAGVAAPSEVSPLLVGQESSVGTEEEYNDARGRAGVPQTVVNLMKTCMGTGCLALPFACQQGGILIFVLGLSGIAAWNVYAVQRLTVCLHYLPHKESERDAQSDDEEEEEEGARTSHEDTIMSPSPTHNDTNPRLTGTSRMEQQTRKRRPSPPEGTSTLGRVAWYAFGRTGLQLMDVMMIILLLGIIVSYLSAVISFVSDTPFSISPLWDALFVASIMAMLSLVPDLGYLSNASAIGLSVLAGTFLVINFYGILGYRATSSSSEGSLALWPANLSGLSRFFGVCVFGFGTVPLTYNFQESMREPGRLVGATAIALTGVSLSYMLIGIGLYALFPNVTGEILHELPSQGILPTATRLAMGLVVVMTAPLLIVPTGELIEGKFQISSRHRWMVRWGVCMVSVVAAVLLPSFVQVLSFVGCACVGLVSFCVPPLLLLRLRHAQPSRSETSCMTKCMFWVDVVMVTWGLIATIIGTAYTLG